MVAVSKLMKNDRGAYMKIVDDDALTDAPHHNPIEAKVSSGTTTSDETTVAPTL